MHTGLLEVCLRSAAVYAFLLLALRLLGKREVGQITLFDVVLLLTLANSVQNAMVGDNSSLPAGLCAAATLMGLDALLKSALGRRLRLKRWVEGSPTLLLRSGRVEWRNLKKEGLGLDELKAAVREHGLAGLEEADLAVLEVDGSISVVGSRPSAGRRPRRKAAVRLRAQ